MASLCQSPFKPSARPLGTCDSLHVLDNEPTMVTGSCGANLGSATGSCCVLGSGRRPRLPVHLHVQCGGRVGRCHAAACQATSIACVAMGYGLCHSQVLSTIGAGSPLHHHDWPLQQRLLLSGNARWRWAWPLLSPNQVLDTNCCKHDLEHTSGLGCQRAAWKQCRLDCIEMKLTTAYICKWCTYLMAYSNCIKQML